MLREVKREDEILQIAHRIRPVWSKSKEDKTLILVSMLPVLELPPDEVLNPNNLGGLERREALEEIIREAANNFGFWMDKILQELFEFHFSAGTPVGTGFRHTLNKILFIRGSTETSAGLASRVFVVKDSYRDISKSKSYAQDRDSILEKLGLYPHRLTVREDSKTKPYKIWGDIDRARDFLTPELESGTSQPESVSESDEILWEYTEVLGQGAYIAERI